MPSYEPKLEINKFQRAAEAIQAILDYLHENPGVTCHTCTKSYMGADSNLRCRLNALIVSPALWKDCKEYEREPGSDDEDQEWCCGRGD